jgi:hypothetical protein
METFMQATKAHGAVAYFTGVDEIMNAVRTARSKGFDKVETYTPFPIHGMEDALGLKPSIVPWATLIGGLTGFSLATHLEIWTSAYDWPINVGGKPLISLPAFLPIMFELTVLLAGLSTAFFMFALNGMPNLRKNPFDPRITDDLFALYIPFEGQKVSSSEVEGFLNTLHAEKVTQVTERI